MHHKKKVNPKPKDPYPAADLFGVVDPEPDETACEVALRIIAERVDPNDAWTIQSKLTQLEAIQASLAQEALEKDLLLSRRFALFVETKASADYSKVEQYKDARHSFIAEQKARVEHVDRVFKIVGRSIDALRSVLSFEKTMAEKGI